jgi:ribosomal protein S18 acetylase RimI-like enzyme
MSSRTHPVRRRWRRAAASASATTRSSPGKGAWRKGVLHNWQTPMITYTDTTEGLSPDSLRGFFVGWLKPPSPSVHLAILRGSDHVVLALEAERVVGFVTALSDGLLYASISLLEVLPEYQGRGIGSELMRRVLARLSNLYATDLLCDPKLQPFYRRLGLRPAVGMMLRNYQHQGGAI